MPCLQDYLLSNEVVVLPDSTPTDELQHVLLVLRGLRVRIGCASGATPADLLGRRDGR